MKKIRILESKFISLFSKSSKPENDVFYQDGDFIVTNNKINKARDLFYPYYNDVYNGNKNKIIHQIAFAKTMRMIDNGKLKALPQNEGNYYSVRNRRFSKEQVEEVERQIYPKFKDMSLEELYDYLLIDMERTSYNTEKDGKKAIAELLNNGFFDEYLNGQLKDIALWNLGKLNDINDMLVWLYTKNKFTGKLNIKTIEDEIKKTHDEIADSDDDFMYNPIFQALNTIQTSLWKINNKG